MRICNLREFSIMNAEFWTAPVTIHLPDNNRPLIIGCASEAAAALADKWPVTYGSRFQRALNACVSSQERHISAEDARLAFIAAADEAGVTIERDQMIILPLPLPQK
jgi:hypothetical protein